ncbi:MAG TPA: Hpt domain-containing protein [Hyphomicrobiaceae bacterium]|nr:Hpt domain-containing protein [Hyphomicrobiaceae bacterium]
MAKGEFRSRSNAVHPHQGWLPGRAAVGQDASPNWEGRAPANEEESAERALDLSKLKKIIGDDPVAIQSALDEFARSMTDDVAELLRAVAEAHSKSTEDVAHRFKGAALIVGASPVAASCQTLEHAAKISDWPAINAEMLRFETKIRDLRRALAGICHRPPATPIS